MPSPQPSTMPESKKSRKRLVPWLQDKLNRNVIKGLKWIDEEQKIWRLPWKMHTQTRWGDPDAFLLRELAVSLYDFPEGREPEQEKLKHWKELLRNNLRSLKEIKELKDCHNNDGENPYKVYQFIEVVSENRRRRREQGSGQHLPSETADSPSTSSARNMGSQQTNETITTQSDFRLDLLPRLEGLVSHHEIMSDLIHGNGSYPGTTLIQHPHNGESSNQTLISQSDVNGFHGNGEMSSAGNTNEESMWRHSDINISQQGSPEEPHDFFDDFFNITATIPGSSQSPSLQVGDISAVPSPNGLDILPQQRVSQMSVNGHRNHEFSNHVGFVDNGLGAFPGISTNQLQNDPALYRETSPDEEIQQFLMNLPNQDPPAQMTSSQQFLPCGVNGSQNLPMSQSDSAMEELHSSLKNVSISDDFSNIENLPSVPFRSRSPIRCVDPTNNGLIQNGNAGHTCNGHLGVDNYYTAITASAPMPAGIPFPRDSFESRGPVCITEMIYNGSVHNGDAGHIHSDSAGHANNDLSNIQNCNPGIPISMPLSACAPMPANISLPPDSFDSCHPISAASLQGTSLENATMEVVVHYFGHHVMQQRIQSNKFRVCYVANEGDRETILACPNQCGPSDAYLLELPLTQYCKILRPKDAHNINKVLENLKRGVTIEYINGDIYATRYSKAVPFFQSQDDHSFIKMERQQRYKVFDFQRVSSLPCNQQSSILPTLQPFSRLTFSLRTPGEFAQEKRALTVDIIHLECVHKKKHLEGGDQHSMEPVCSLPDGVDAQLSLERNLKMIH